MIITPSESEEPATAAELGDSAAMVVARLGTAPDTGANGTSGVSGLAERCVWSLVWLGVISGGFQLWGSWSAWSFGGLAAPLLVLAGIVGFAAVWLVGSPRSTVIQLSALAAVVASTLGNEGIGIHARRFYSTDSAAFDQAGARLLMHGIDPYTVTLGSLASLLKVPAQFWTYTVSGGHVDHVSYPAGSILLQMPALVLGFHHEVVDWMDLLAWIVTGVIIFVLLPTSIRWIAPLLLLAPAFTGVFSSGGTDAAFLPFLVLAVWRWDRFGLGRSAGVARWMGPVALGLACSIKQTPWFCVPFIALGLVVEARRSGRNPVRTVVPYLAIVAGVFGVVNIPFVIWSPAAWARGTFLPFLQPLIADGQGLVTLVLHGIAHGVSLPLLTLAGLLVLGAELAAMVIWYPAMKRIWLLLLPLAFFVATRSLSTYLADLYPAAIVAAVSVAPAPRAVVAAGPGASPDAGRTGGDRPGGGRGVCGGPRLLVTAPAAQRAVGGHLQRRHLPRRGDPGRAQHDLGRGDAALHGDHRQRPSRRVLVSRSRWQPGPRAPRLGDGDHPTAGAGMGPEPWLAVAGRGLHHLARGAQHDAADGLAARPGPLKFVPTRPRSRPAGAR